MTREQEALDEFLKEYLFLCEKLHTNMQEKMLLDSNSPYNGLKTYLEAIDNVNSSEAMKCLERIDNTLCLNNNKGNLEFGVDTEEHTDCDSAIGMVNDLETIKNALLKEQELHNGGRLPNKEILYLKQSIEQGNDKPVFYVSRTYGNKYIVPQKQFDDLVKENTELKAKAQKECKALEIIKEKLVDVFKLYNCKTVEEYNQAQYRDCMLTEEEFNLLKEVLG